MNKFITVTHASGRAIININHISAILEDDGKIYIGSSVEGHQPLEVLETYDDIIYKLQSITDISK